jgi:hypothetical protein
MLEHRPGVSFGSPAQGRRRIEFYPELWHSYENFKWDTRMAASTTFDTEKVKQNIARIREKIHTEVNPQLLNEYRLLFKREISFFRRSWVAAYLLMLHDQEQGRNLPNSRGDRGAAWASRPKAKGPARAEAPRGNGRDQGKERRDQGGGQADTAAYGAAPDRPSLPEEESRRLFISIGRNRHLFPREVLGLIITKVQVAREDIGAIRILDSYSFVQVRDTVADAIIKALNGAMFRGRTLVVNYARSKREEGGEETAAEDPGDGREVPAGGTTGMAAAADDVRDDAAYDTAGGAGSGEGAFTFNGDGSPDDMSSGGGFPDDGPSGSGEAAGDGTDDVAEDQAAPEDSPDAEFPLEQGDDHHDKEGV